MVPLVVAPLGGKLPNGMAVQRTFGATRSVEFDALLVAGRAGARCGRPPGPRQQGGRAVGTRAWTPASCCCSRSRFRHAKAIGAWGAGVQALEEAGVDPDSPGVVTADSAAAVFAELHEVLGSHRVWERFTPVLV